MPLLFDLYVEWSRWCAAWWLLMLTLPESLFQTKSRLDRLLDQPEVW